MAYPVTHPRGDALDTEVVTVADGLEQGCAVPACG